MDTQLKRLQSICEGRFAPLNVGESRLLHAMESNEWLDLSSDEEEGFNPEYANQWPSERNIRALVIKWLCLSREAGVILDRSQIKIQSARIVGELDFTGAQLPFPIILKNCLIDGRFTLVDAHLLSLSLEGSILQPASVEESAFVGDNLKMEGSIFFTTGFEAQGEVRMLGASIGGDLTCRGGRFRNLGGDALDFSTAKIGGNVFLDRQFEAHGAVRLIGAIINGELRCDGALFDNDIECALNAFRAQVGGDMSFSKSNFGGSTHAFHAKGSICLNTTKIGGDLILSGAVLGSPGHAASAKRQAVLQARNSRIEGEVRLDQGFRALGDIFFPNAVIGSSLSLADSFCGGDVIAERQHVAGDLNFGENFETTGVVHLTGCKIGGTLDFTKAKFTGEGQNGIGVIAQSANIEGRFRWVDVDLTPQTTLNLNFAEASVVIDDEASWPHPGRLILNWFRYEGFQKPVSDEPTLEGTAEKVITTGVAYAAHRLKWLGLQRNRPFHSQPYNQLMTALRRAGLDAGLAQIGYAREEARRKNAGLSRWGSIWLQLLRITIGHGYYPQLAFAWGALIILIGAWVFHYAHDLGLLIPTSQISTRTFSAIGFSLDLFLPIITTGESKAWIPSGAAPWVSVYMWIHLAFGWALTTLGVLGFTPVVRKKE